MELEGNSEGSELDLQEYGFDPNKQMTGSGVMRSGVRFAEGGDLETPEPSKLVRTVRKDTAFTQRYNQTVRLESGLILDTKQSNEETLQKEADEIFVSRKFRHQLLEQYLTKARWRFDNRNQVESNARLVEWEDGSYSLFIGDAHYDIEGHSTPNETYYTVQDDVMVQQDRLSFSGKINQGFKLPAK